MSVAAESLQELVLTVAEFSPAPAGGRTRRLRGGRLTVGRAAPSDWILDDPERMLSKQHCRFEWKAGAYHVVDTSTNGVFVNGAEGPLGAGNSAKLMSGDILALGAYSLRVTMSGPAAVLSAKPPPTEPLLPEDDWLPPRNGAMTAVEPAAVFAGRVGTSGDNREPQDDFFRPPAVEAGGIPDDWYLDVAAGAEPSEAAAFPSAESPSLPGAAAAEAAADELRAHVAALHEAVTAILARLPPEAAAEAARVLQQTYAAARYR